MDDHPTVLPHAVQSQDEARFWAKVHKGDTCWIWTANKNRSGYGRFRFHGDYYFAHRFSFLLAYGHIDPNMYVCHRCDNPACVRPDHLFMGLPKANAQDRDAKGRAATGDRHWTRQHPERVPRGLNNGAYTRPDRVLRGEANGQSKLDATQVARLKARIRDGATDKVIAAEFGVHVATVWCIRTGRNWRHVA